MGNVIAFAKPEPKDPHASGEAICMTCGHEWVAVAPITGGAHQLECPECHTMKGHFKWPFAPNAEDKIWACDCGCTQFWILADYHMCPNCGTKQVYFD